jgi:hypothetical protein
VPAQSEDRIALHNVDIANSFAKAKFGNVDLTDSSPLRRRARHRDWQRREQLDFSLGAFGIIPVKIALGHVRMWFRIAHACRLIPRRGLAGYNRR